MKCSNFTQQIYNPKYLRSSYKWLRRFRKNRLNIFRGVMFNEMASTRVCNFCVTFPNSLYCLSGTCHNRHSSTCLNPNNNSVLSVNSLATNGSTSPIPAPAPPPQPLGDKKESSPLSSSSGARSVTNISNIFKNISWKFYFFIYLLHLFHLPHFQHQQIQLQWVGFLR